MRKLALLAIPVALFLVADQVLLHTVLSDGIVFGRRIAPFCPPLFTDQQDGAARRLRDAGETQISNVRFDAELGWATRESFTSGEFTYDARGARMGAMPVPAARTAGVRRAAAFGCSFTHGDEVGGADAWCATLDADRADLEVENFGVGGYGIDQALLHYRRLAPQLDVDEVWLGFMPRAALRVLSMYRPALTHDDASVAMKPRFESNTGGSLHLTPMPVASAQELGAFVLADDDRFVRALGDHDVFVRRSRAAYEPRGASLWHMSFAARLLLTKLEASGRSPDDALRDVDGECFRVLLAIARAFRAEAEARGDRFRLLLLPDRPSLDAWKAAQQGGAAPAYATFVAALRADGIEVVDVVDALAAADTPGANLYGAGGHWTPNGNRVVAERLATLLR